MNKRRTIKTAIITSAFIVATSVTAFAQSGMVELKKGYCYLYGDTDNSAILRRADAGTVPEKRNEHSSLTLLTTTYYNGDEYTERDGIRIGPTNVNHDWEYADGYESNHRIIVTPIDSEHMQLFY